MKYNYKIPSLSIKKNDLFKKLSLTSKDYSELFKPIKSIPLKNIVSKHLGESFSSKDFIPKNLCEKYRCIKTGNLSEYKYTLDFTTTEYCKNRNNGILENGDILIAKDGAGKGLGEVGIYQNENDLIEDYFSAEVLMIRVNPAYDKWYIFAMLKFQHFKDYMDICTPEGTSFRHSNLIALDYDLPIPNINSEETINYISLLTQNIIDKESQIKIKKKQIDEIINNELNYLNQQTAIHNFTYPSISSIKTANRLDTGIYTKDFFDLCNIIYNYHNGYFYLDVSQVKPGETPKDYKYSSEKTDGFYLWITSSNIKTLELLYNDYIKTEKETRLINHSIVLSSIRHLGYGYLIKDEIAYCNQNTLIINYSNDINEQILLLEYLTSTIGKKFQLAFRVDGLVPIIYSEDLTKIPIPKFSQSVQNKLIPLYYNNIDKSCEYNSTNYLSEENIRNKALGIYQLNKEVLNLKTILNFLLDNIIKGIPIDIDYNLKQFEK